MADFQLHLEFFRNLHPGNLEGKYKGDEADLSSRVSKSSDLVDELRNAFDEEIAEDAEALVPLRQTVAHQLTDAKARFRDENNSIATMASD